MLKEISSLQFGEFTLDRHAREVRRLETVLPITGKAFDLLTYMVENPGRPLSKTELLEAVWPETSVEESNLSQNVFLLRRVLGSGSDGPIKTLPGRGYQFAAQVQELVAGRSFETYTGPAAGTSSISVETTRRRTIVEDDLEERAAPWRSIVLAVAAVVVLAALGAAVYLHHRSAAGSQTVKATTPGNPASRPAVAVLGFRNASSRPEDAWLTTAVAEMVATEMSSGEDLRVIPRNEVARAESSPDAKINASGREADRAGMQQATGADILVHGSYVVAGNGPTPGLRLMVQVEDAHTGKQIASFSETGRLGELFALIDQTGTQLRKDLSDRDADAGQALSAMSQNTDALRLYAEAVEQARRFDANSARGLFESAIQADPNFALAHLGMADAWSDLGFTQRAAEEAGIAYKLSSNLPKEQRLAIEADYRSLSGDSAKAIALYKALTTFYPDDEAWGLHLAEEQEGATLFHDAIDTLERLRHLPLTAAQNVEVTTHEAVLHMLLNTPEGVVKAHELVAEAVSIAGQQASPLVRGQAYRAQCYVFSALGPFSEARQVCEQAKSTYQAAGNLLAVASAENNLAGLAAATNDSRTAEVEYTEAQRMFHELGDVHDEYYALNNLCLTSLQSGDLDATVRQCTTLAGAHDTGEDNNFVFYGNLYRGTAERYEGKLQDARIRATAALQTAEKRGDGEATAFDEAMAERLLAQVALDGGDLGESDAAFHRAEVLLAPKQHELSSAELVTERAELRLEQGHPDKPEIEELRRAVTSLAKNQEENDMQMKGDILLARMEMAMGANPDAAHALDAARQLDGKNTWEESHLQLLLARAALERTLGHSDNARAILKQEIDEAQSRRFAYLELSGQVALATLSQRTAPSAENENRLRAIGQQAEHAGFKGLAHQALAPQA